MPGVYGSSLPTLPIELLAWLATSALHSALFGLRWVYGLARLLHIVGAASFFGVLLVIEAHRLSRSSYAIRPPLVGLLHGGFAVTIASGLVLLVYDPIGAGLHSLFLTKLLLVVLGLAYAHGIRKSGPFRAIFTGRLAAGLGLAIWLLVFGAATWNHVERPVAINAILRAKTIGHE